MKLCRILIALIVSSQVFIVAEFFFPVNDDNYDGIVSLISLPLVVLLINVIFIPLTWGIGYLLNRGAFQKVWNRMGWGVLVISAIGTGMYIFCEPLGLLEDDIGPKGQPIQVMKGFSWPISLFLLFYPLVNLPDRLLQMKKGCLFLVCLLLVCLPIIVQIQWVYCQQYKWSVHMRTAYIPLPEEEIPGVWIGANWYQNNIEVLNLQKDGTLVHKIYNGGKEVISRTGNWQVEYCNYPNIKNAQEISLDEVSETGRSGTTITVWNTPPRLVQGDSGGDPYWLQKGISDKKLLKKAKLEMPGADFEELLKRTKSTDPDVKIGERVRINKTHSTEGTESD